MQRQTVRRGWTGPRIIAWNLAGCGALALAAVAFAQDKKPDSKPDAGESQSVSLKVIVPKNYEGHDEPDAKLWINDKPTKQGGEERKFESSPLKPSKAYFYTLKVLWEPNNYTKITRTRKLEVKPGGSYTVDLTKREKDDPPEDIVVRFVATPDHLVDKLIALAKVGKDDVVFDLGCGDGSMVCRAIANAGAKRGVGVDIDPARIKDSKAMAKKYKVEDKVVWREGDVLKQIDDLEDATVVMLYMGDEIGARLSPILQKRLKPGSRVVSHRFTLGDWKPDKTITVDDPNRTNSDDKVDLHLWTVKEKKETEKKDTEKKETEKKETEKKETEKKG